MSDGVILALVFMVFIGGIVTLITFINLAGDVEYFEPYPQRENCIMVDWEINRVSGTDENKSGIYCLEDIND